MGTESLSVQVGRTLRAARERTGWTQSQLAERCGLVQSVIARTEAGQTNVTAKTVEVIAAALGVVPELKLRRPQKEVKKEGGHEREGGQAVPGSQ